MIETVSEFTYNSSRASYRVKEIVREELAARVMIQFKAPRGPLRLWNILTIENGSVQSAAAWPSLILAIQMFQFAESLL